MAGYASDNDMSDIEWDEFAPASKEKDSGRPYRAAVHVGKGEVIGTIESPAHPNIYLSANLKLMSHKDWKNYILLKFFMRQTVEQFPEAEEHAKDINLYNNQIRFDKRCLAPHGLSLTQVTPENEPDLTTPELKVKRDNASLWRLVIRYDSKLVQIAGLKNNVYAGRKYPELETLHARLRERGEIALFVVGRQELKNQFDQFLLTLAKEKNTIPLWYPKHPTKIFIEAGESPAPDERPLVELSAATTFTSYDEYQTVLGFASIQEEEHTVRQIEELGECRTEIRLINVPASNNSRLFGVFKLPDHVQKRLGEDDSIKIHFNPEQELESDVWSATAIRPLAFAPVGYVSVVIYRPYDKKAKTYRQMDLHILQLTAKAWPELLQQLADHPTHVVGISMVHSGKVLKNQIISLDALTRNEDCAHWRKFLVGMDTIGTRIDDITQHWTQEAFDFLKLQPLSETQLQTIYEFRNIRNGVAIVTGPPGTGKTHIIMHTVLPLLFPVVKGAKQNRVLITSPNNGPVDEIAELLYGETQKYAGLKDKIVIRVHALSTETELIEETAKRTGTRAQYDANPIDMNEVAQWDQFTLTHQLWKVYDSASARPYGVQDKRLKKEWISLTTWMLRIAGIIDQHPLADPKRHESFRSLYEQYQAGFLDQEDLEAFHARAKELRKDTLSKADVLVMTMLNASVEAIKSVVKPSLIIVDEAARAPEPYFWYLMANYPSPPLILVGDDAQLRPVILSKLETNGMVKQLALSLFTRLKAVGHPSAILLDQHRQVPILAELTNTLYYHGQFRNGPGTAIDQRPHAQVLEKYIKKKFGFTGTSTVMVKFKAKAEMDSTKSLFNLVSARAVMEILEEILRLRKIPPTDIAIIAFYKAQVNLLRASVDNLHCALPHLRADQVEVRTVDGFQGAEKAVILLDVVVTSKTGFVKQVNRLNVATSRARDGMFVFADMGQILKQDPRHRPHISEVFQFFQTRQLVKMIRPNAECPYLPTTFTAPTHFPITLLDYSPQWYIVGDEATEADQAAKKTAVLTHHAGTFPTSRAE